MATVKNNTDEAYKSPAHYKQHNLSLIHILSAGCWDFGYDNPVETIGVYAEGWVGHGWLSKNGLKK